MKRIIPFLNYRWYAISFSMLLLMAFVATIVARGGWNMGVDFVGGVKIIARFEKGIDEGKIRTALEKFNPMVQQIGEADKNEYIINTKLKEGQEPAKEADLVGAKLKEVFGSVQIMSVENVGPAVGAYLRGSVYKLTIMAILLMMVYLAYRFEFKYAIACMVALIHDVTLAAVFSGAVGIEFNIPIVAALLTIFGFSVNDTIVIFDRIRENLQGRTKQSFIEIINRSITETMSRTILTSLTVAFSVLSLYVLGGEGINDFALVMLFGLFCGSYSTIFIASPVVVGWDNWRSRKSRVEPVKG